MQHDRHGLCAYHQIIVMDQGVIAQCGTAQDLYEYPKSEFVAGFMSEAMLLPAQADANGMVSLRPLRGRRPGTLARRGQARPRG